MEQIYDLSKIPYSNRHGIYGGAAGNKDGIKADILVTSKNQQDNENSSYILLIFYLSPISQRFVDRLF